MIRTNTLFALLVLVLLGVSCQKEQVGRQNDVPQTVIDQLLQLGFNPDGIVKVDDGYLIERDILITSEFLAGTPVMHRVPGLEQYSTNNLVDAGNGRNIACYIPTGGRTGFSSTYVAALDEAISRYNAESLFLTFSRVSSSGAADIVFTRLAKGDERRGVLGSAGFPTSGGDPYGQIKMSGILESTYGLSIAGIATIMAHEMGHCIGFRHTDYFDRSISCNTGGNEGDGGVGANQIPGTPSGADLAGNGSWMLSCTDGSSRPFTHYDQVALDYLY